LEPFTHWEEMVDPAEEGALERDLVARAWVIKDSKQDLLERRIGIFGKERALQMTSETALGVVGRDEWLWKKGYSERKDRALKDREPKTCNVKGWTWQEVAKKRALRNAIRKSHGQPTATEIREQAWIINGVETIPSDWLAARANAPAFERAAEAQLTAEARTLKAKWDAMTDEERRAEFERDRELLRGDGVGEAILNGEVIETEVADPAEFDVAASVEDWAQGICTPAGTAYRDLNAEQLVYLWGTFTTQTKEGKAAYLYARAWLDHWDRPYTDPFQLTVRLWLEAGSGMGMEDETPATDPQKGLVAGKLNEAFADAPDPDAWRHSFLKFHFNKDSVTTLTFPEAGAVIQWLVEQKDDTGDYPLKLNAVSEAFSTVRAAMEAAGQMDMFAPDVDLPDVKVEEVDEIPYDGINPEEGPDDLDPDEVEPDTAADADEDAIPF
jgi:hypothetical protein